MKRKKNKTPQVVKINAKRLRRITLYLKYLVFLLDLELQGKGDK